MGSFNMNKQNLSGIDFIKYLAYQNGKFKLTPSGEIQGMGVYQYNARSHKKTYSKPGEDYTTNTYPSENETSSNDDDQSEQDIVPATDDAIPNPLDPWKTIYPPHLLNPPPSNLIELYDQIIDLNTLSPKERKDTIEEWQCVNIFNFSQEQSPLGYIYAFQEPSFLEKYGKMASWAKNQKIHYDRTSIRPRAGIICSPNMDCWLQRYYTDDDVCTVSWNSGTEHGEIFIISYYGENNKKGKRDNIVISQTLRKTLNKCKRDKIPFILLGDLNAWSFEWGMPMRNPNNINWWRGEVWEEAMIDFGMTCLNVGNEWTRFKGDTIREEQGLEPINSIIDVCFCSNELASLVSNWMVRDAAPASDHASLEFCFHLNYPGHFQCFETVYDYGKGDYPRYSQTVEEGCPDIYSNEGLEHGNYDDFNKEVNEFITLIKQGAEKHIPTKTLDRRTVPDHTFSWWNSDCRKWRNKLTKIRSYLRKIDKHPLKPGEKQRWTINDRRETIRMYNKAQRKARKKHWDKTLENKKSNRDLGKLLTSLKPNANAEVNCFTNNDGTTMTPKDTLNTLVDEHFPGCKKPAQREVCPEKLKRDNKVRNSYFDIKDRRANVITMEKLKKSIADFASLKGTGTDGIPPILFKRLGPKALERLLRIFKASFVLGLLSEQWLEVKVIFIPKPGKENYFTPRSFRPISLMQFMLKIMERLIMFVIREDADFELHENQHGFVDFKSCDSNLTAWVNTIEKGFADWGFTLGVYIDIKGAFDNVTNAGLEKMMTKRGCSRLIIDWFKDFLNNRNIQIKYKGLEVKAWPIKGTPQGGVASPWLYNIIADEIHQRIGNQCGIETLGYADDTIVYIRTNNPQQAVDTMNDIALPMVLEWANEFGLEIAPDKTVAILYTKRQERKPGNKINKDGTVRGSFDIPTPVRFMGKEVEWSYNHKHLGVFIEEKLNFKIHINSKIKKAKGLLIQLRNCMGKIHGLQPNAALTFYKWCRSMLTHGCLVWHTEVYNQGILDKLRNFQSTGLRTMGVFCSLWVCCAWFGFYH